MIGLVRRAKGAGWRQVVGVGRIDVISEAVVVRNVVGDVGEARGGITGRRGTDGSRDPARRDSMGSWEQTLLETIPK